MASTTETGHAKNVANFEDLISFCNAYGPAYNPSKASIQISQLNTKFTDATDALARVNNKLAPYTIAVNSRDEIFAPLSKLVTRIVNAVAASDVPKDVVDDVKSIARKLQGRRASTPKPSTPAATPAEETPKTISASQMSFDSRIENMDKLIKLLEAQTGYSPNETDLTVTALTTLYNNLRAANTAVVSANTNLSNTRIDRNDILYNPTSGLVQIASDVKAYVKSLFGATSPQYKQISNLKFVKPKL